MLSFTTKQARRDKAIVIGAGIGGLLSAYVLAKHYRLVEVWERDDSLSNRLRRGLAQGGHFHILLKRGEACISNLLTGFSEAINKSGFLPLQVGTMRWLGPFGPYPEFVSGVGEVYCIPRPELDAILYRLVRLHKNVKFRFMHEVTGFKYNADRQQVSGVTSPVGTETANLVVDTSGRRGLSRRALKEWDCGIPAKETIPAPVTYATQYFRQTPDTTVPSAPGVYIQMIPGLFEQGGGIFRLNQEGLYIVTLATSGPHELSQDGRTFRRVAKNLRDDSIYRFISSGEPLTDISLYRIAGSSRFHLGKAQRWPMGLLALGDSLCNWVLS